MSLHKKYVYMNRFKVINNSVPTVINVIHVHTGFYKLLSNIEMFKNRLAGN